MRPNTKPQLKFDPAESDIPAVKKIFESQTAKILWCCIRSNHIVDQFFNDIILNTAKSIDECENIRWLEYWEFKKLCQGLTSVFGRLTISGFNCYWYEIDHEYWGTIYECITHKHEFEIEIIKP